MLVDDCRQSARQRMRRRLHGIGWQLMILVTAAIDISILFVELGGVSGAAVNGITLTVLIIFSIDLLLRLATYQKLFFFRIWNNVDFFVLIASFILFLVGLVVDDSSGTGNSTSTSAFSGASSAIAVTRGSRALRGVVIALRIVRGVRVAKTLANAGRGTQLAARHLTGELSCPTRGNSVAAEHEPGGAVSRVEVEGQWRGSRLAKRLHSFSPLSLHSSLHPVHRLLSTSSLRAFFLHHLFTGENKKRFVDLEQNFDLDLVYVCPQLIAMSVPAVGKLSLYRNPLTEVRGS